MDQTYTPLELLTKVLKDRNIPVPEQELRSLFGSSGDAGARDHAIAWIQEYLFSGTLLSPEEHRLFEGLRESHFPDSTSTPGSGPIDRSAVVSNWGAGPATVPGGPFLDDEIKEAIKALESATDALDKQSATLEVQRNALLALKSANSGLSNPKSGIGPHPSHRAMAPSSAPVGPGGGPGRRSASSSLASRAAAAHVDRRRRKYATEMSELVLKIEDGSYKVRAQLEAKQKEAQSWAASAVKQVEAMVEDDDRKLEGLATLQEQLVTGKGSKGSKGKPGEGGDGQAQWVLPDDLTQFVGLDGLPVDGEDEEEEDLDLDQLMELIQKTVQLRIATETARVDAVYNTALAEPLDQNLSLDGFSPILPNSPTRIPDLDDVKGPDSTPDPNSLPYLRALRSAVQVELDSLFAEIPTVTDLCADRSLRRPVQKAIATETKNQTRNRREALDRILDTLSYLEQSASAAAEYVEQVGAFGAVVEQVKKEMPVGKGGMMGGTDGKSVSSSGGGMRPRAASVTKHPLAGAGLLPPPSTSGKNRSAAEAALQHFGFKLDAGTLAYLTGTNVVTGTDSGSGPDQSSTPAPPFSMTPQAAIAASNAAITATRSLWHDIAMKRLTIATQAETVASALRPIIAATDREEGEVLELAIEASGQAVDDDDVEGVGGGEGEEKGRSRAKMRPGDRFSGPGVRKALEEVEEAALEVAKKVEWIERAEWWEELRKRVSADV